MERPRMRPLFKLVLPLSAARLMAEIRERLSLPRSRFAGSVLKRHVELTIHPEHRHFWSPHLSVDVFEDDGGTTLRGRFGPHPNIWTCIMAIYGALIMLSLIATVYGLSQWNLGWTPWALSGLPVCALGAGLTWLTSLAGQRAAQAQMLQLEQFFSDCVARASLPPEAPEPLGAALARSLADPLPSA